MGFSPKYQIKISQKTPEGDYMNTVKQLTVFVENKPGRAANITSILAEGGIDLISFNIADTSEYGLLRFIADDPDKAKEMGENGNLAVKKKYNWNNNSKGLFEVYNKIVSTL